ncbi:DUF1566 domain-containing protein [Thiothrix lacustris]|uniref:Lcl domain-containing protein n=1 Tax=Thiothrix lacustris TaxID=525917 RepID=UPI00048FEA8E|nr:DUF1566 domain-containing protein [Thiothrix lacustris]
MKMHSRVNHPQYSNNKGWLIASILTSSLLTACGSGGSDVALDSTGSTTTALASTNSTETTSQTTTATTSGTTTTATAAETAAAQAAAATAAATAAAQAAAQLAGDLASAKKLVSDALANAKSDATSAKDASDTVARLAQQTTDAVKSYPTVAQSAAMTTFKSYVTQVSQYATTAAQQSALAEQEQVKAQNSSDLAVINAAAQAAQTAASAANAARLAAEKIVNDTWTLLGQINNSLSLEQAITTIPAISTTAETVSGRYIKLDNTGKALPAAATSWACVKDKNTGLIWEEKTNDGGLRDKDWRYRHYHNYAGYGNTVDYNGVQLCAVLGTCDSYTYRDTVNSEGFCGRKGVWRLPLRAELGSIAQINAGDKTPHINQSIFPETANIYKKSAYCAENMASTAADCGYAAGTALHYTDDGRIECNYQGVDYTQPLLGRTTAMLEQSILVPLRLHGGEVEDGLPIYPQANWVCYTRLVSDH